MAELPDGSVDCLVTSPPYWRLRDYAPSVRAGGHSQIGLEETADGYVAALRAVFAAARRVLAPRATVWLNLGDSYSTNSDGYWCAARGQDRQPHYRPRADVPHKNLLGMPWRVAFALQQDGWLLRSAIVWHKPHTTPTQVQDRLATRSELIFLLVSQLDYYFDTGSVRRSWGARGQPGDVWTISPDRSRSGHPAPSPVEIPRRCIAAGCPPGGHVLDPFSGSGTTGIAARELGRRFTGIDTNAEYHRIALRRLTTLP
ncbi:site-specific DNA-methyltransferase [Saccharothrix sp. AJ9571]|nr:site-specific DNA-methyltransferase [Saccharothrix sp. AJ9571]